MKDVHPVIKLAAEWISIGAILALIIYLHDDSIALLLLAVILSASLISYHFIAQRWQQQLEVKKQEVNKELRHAKKLAEQYSRVKIDFLSNISHEIRTPLNGIIGNLSLLQDSALTLEQKRYLRLADASGKALSVLLTDLLDIACLEEDHVDFVDEVFDAQEVIDDISGLFGEACYKKGVELVVLYSSFLPTKLIGDPRRLRQLLSKLLNNAVKFTASGEILLLVYPEPIDEHSISLRVAVCDTGIGIDDTQKQEIFSLFYQGDTSSTRKYGGLGIGLALCKKIVDRCNGYIGVQSTVKRGSSFWFAIPMKLSEESAVKAAATIQGKVLVISAKPISRIIFYHYLSQWRLDHRSVTSVDEGIRILQTAKGHPYDVVLVDTLDVSHDIEQIQKALEAQSPECRPKFIGAGSQYQYSLLKPEQVEHLQGYVMKPVRGEQLFSVMQLALANKVEQAVNHASSIHRILIVEDNVVNQQITKACLKKLGYGVEIAENGQIAIQKLEQAAFDLVIMDCQMPIMDGFEATLRIRRHQNEMISQIPIIALTANDTPKDKERCFRSGMNDFMAKPLDRSLLVEKLNSWLLHYAASHAKCAS